MKHTYCIPSEFLNQQVNVHLIGAGGTGSLLLQGLGRIHHALLSCGHPKGLHVTVWDNDKVSAANVGRQLFPISDIGQYKAVVLTNRLNLFYGLDWTAMPRMFNDNESDLATFSPTLFLTAVDSLAARKTIANILYARNTPLWLWMDFGNRQRDGQIILSEVCKKRQLPNLFDLFPELKTAQEDESTPSCSLAEALTKQDLFVNQAVATYGLNLLWRLFREPITIHGAFVNLETGCATGLPIRTPSPKKTEK